MKEEIYDDFVTKMLPQIQQGLTITKDYFLDLFGRYIKYLIIMDSISLFFSIVLFVISLVFFIKSVKIGIEEDWEINLYMFLLFVSFVGTVILPVAIYKNTKNLSKTIFIPEVRVYEEFKLLNK